MKWQKIFQPTVILSAQELKRGLHALTWEGVVSTGFSSLTASTFLAAFALALGANNLQIGILAALPFITDILQIPGVWLIEKIRKRKKIIVLTWLVSQLFWIPVALIPVIMEIPGQRAIVLLIVLMAARGMLNAMVNCGWSSWKRDLVPQNILGRYFARRLSLATALAIVLGLSAGMFLDKWSGGGALAYTFVLLTGLAVFGIASPVLMAFVPEPVMPPIVGRQPSFTKTITGILHDKNYRHFLKYLTLWGFASNLAIPFFAVFMLQQMKLSIFTVIALTTLSEISVVVSLRIWGPFADKFGNKNVLKICSSLFLLVLAGWAATAITGDGALQLSTLALLHIFSGIAVAGITLTTGTLSFKLTPQGRATPYLTGASLADSAGIGLGALVGGYLVDLFNRHISVLHLSLKGVIIEVTGYHLLFIMALVIGMITLKSLAPLTEMGAARKEIVLSRLINGAVNTYQWFTLVPNYITMQWFLKDRYIPGSGIGESTDNGVRKNHTYRNLKEPGVVTLFLHTQERKPPSGKAPLFQVA